MSEVDRMALPADSSDDQGRCRVEGCPRDPTPGHGITVCGEHEREWDRAWKGRDFGKVPLAEKKAAWARFLRNETIHA